MDYWQELVNTALLGTSKKRVDATALPQPLRQAAENMAACDQETQLLQLAALATQYRRAGIGPEKYTLPALAACEPETQPYCPPAASRLLSSLLDESLPDGTLLEYWLDRCLANGWVVPPQQVVKLLEAGAEKKHHFLQAKLRPLAGKRGQWLATMHEKWHYLLEASFSPEQVWQEGRPGQRKEVFQTLRERDPAKARQWLEQTWLEESAKDRKDFLELLRINLSPSDEAFLQNLKEEVAALGNKVKAIHSELNAAATRLLLSLPDSALSRRVWDQVKTYFHQTPRWLGLTGNPVVKLVLPEKEDHFFNAALMHEQFGFGQSSPLSRYSNAQYWLNELVRLIPPSRWQEHFDGDARKVLVVFTRPEGGFVKVLDRSGYPLYAGALADAAYLHKDTEWAAAWLALFPEMKFNQELQPHMLRLCELLPQAALEKFSEANISQPTAHENLFIHPRLQQWSLPFTHFVLQSTRASAGDYYRLGRDQQFVGKAIRHIPEEVLAQLEPYRRIAADSSEHAARQWMDRIEIPLTHLLHLRQAIEKM